VCETIAVDTAEFHATFGIQNKTGLMVTLSILSQINP